MKLRVHGTGAIQGKIVRAEISGTEGAGSRVSDTRIPAMHLKRFKDTRPYFLTNVSPSCGVTQFYFIWQYMFRRTRILFFLRLENQSSFDGYTREYVWYRRVYSREERAAVRTCSDRRVRVYTFRQRNTDACRVDGSFKYVEGGQRTIATASIADPFNPAAPPVSFYPTVSVRRRKGVAEGEGIGGR